MAGRLIPLVAAIALVLALAGAALALRGPQATDTPAPLSQDSEDAEPLSAATLDRIVTKLGDAGVTTDADTVAGLAAEHGVGGAVRLLLWPDADTSMEDILAMRAGDAETAPMGWGRIAKDLGIRPGIGHVMGGGSGLENAPGQAEDE